MNDELSKLGAAFIAVSTVPDEELRQIAELFDGEISRKTCLSAFLADDSNSNISCLDHGHVVPTIANTARSLPGVGTDEFRHISFLRGRTATCDNRGKSDCSRNEGFAMVSEHERKGFSIDKKASVGFISKQVE